MMVLNTEEIVKVNIHQRSRDMCTLVEGHFNPGLFNPKLQPQTFQPQTSQP
jgi:hypothetical protein